MKCALLIFFAAGIYAAPFWVLDQDLPTTEIKDIGCKANRFQTGESYVYEYAGESLNNIEGASETATGIQLRSKVTITSLANCKFTMSLNGAELLSKSKTGGFVRTPESNQFQKEIEQNELSFTMTDNKIINIEAPKDEKTHVLNIKRGILSTLQLNQDSTTETDINGVCEMKITNEDGKIVKTKDLASCSNRAVNEIGIQTTTIKADTTMKPLDCKSKCVYKVSNDMIQSVVCNEEHLFRPFSAGHKTPSGAMTTVQQSMRFVQKQRPETRRLTVDMGEPMSLVFDHSSEELSASKAMNEQFDDVMGRLVSGSSLSVTQESAHEFTSMVFLLRKMDEKRMTTTWKKYFNCISSGMCTSTQTDLRDVYRQYLLDGVAYCGTSNCISMVRNVIIQGEVTGERMNMFLQSIALVGQTTKQMIEDVLEIVKKQPSRQAYLTLGTLMARHCGKTPEECTYSRSNPVTRAEEFLVKKLGNACEGQKNHERVEEIVMTLKAIGNAHRPIRVRSTLLRCGKNAQHSNITRAAFDAFRGMPCDGEQTDDILHVLTDADVDPEIRIHAFVAVMNCPSEDVIDHVLHDLDREQSNQVASFMSTHLTNIMESSDIKNQEAKRILEKFSKTTPIRKVDLPFYKFSKSYEKSLRLDSIKSGASVAGQIIYNNDGYFPKSGLMNFTAEVLGTEVNVLEAAIAVDGLEAVVANAFGPNGVLPDNFMLNIFNFTYTSEKLREMSQRSEEQRTRSKRGSNGDKLSQIHNRVNMKPKPLSGDFSIKVMGQEVRVFSYDDIYQMIDEIDNMNVVQLLMNVAKGGHKTFTKSMMFMEMTHTVPTGLGLPLKLKLIGSTAASVELDGKFDIRNMFWGRGAINVNGYVKPSAVVEISGEMGVESQFVRSGMFVNSSMFVSNMVKGSVQYQEGKLFKINVDTPSEPVQLFNVSSTPFLYLNEEKTMIEGAPRTIKPDVCMKSKILGYGICTNMRLPVAFREYEAPYYPLSGPAYFGVKLVRGDEKLTTFQFMIQMIKQSTKTTGTIEFSTPGATYERRVSGEMVYTDINNDKVLTLSTKKWGKRAEVEFGYNTLTRNSYITTKNNIFTKKDLITTLKYFNQSNQISKQFGLLMAAEYDVYKFQEEIKYVQKSTEHMLTSTSTYYPDQTITGVLEYNTVDKKLSARLDSKQLQQSAEVTGQWQDQGETKGFQLTATHLTTGKTATVYAGFVNKDNEKELVLSATAMDKKISNIIGYYQNKGILSVANVLDINGKTARLSFSYDNLKKDKVVSLDADIFGYQANTDYILVNSPTEKSLTWIVYVNEKAAMTKAGLYIENELKTLKWNVDIDGRKAEIFANIHSAEGYRTTVGGIVGKYVAGVRGVYTDNHGHGNSICTSAYYGTTSQETEPMMLCAKYHALGTSFVHNKLTLSAKHTESNKKAEIEFDFEKHTGHVKLAGELKYEGKIYAKNQYEIRYSDWKNTEIKMDVEVGKYTTGWKLFTETSGETTNIGAHGYVMDKTMTFLNILQQQTRGGQMEMNLRTQLTINGRTLPVTTEFNLLSAEGVQSPSFKIIVGKYALKYASSISYTKSEYSHGAEFLATKNEETLFGLTSRSALTMKAEKELSQKFGIIVAGRTYEYGWEAAYENQGTAAKSSHVVTFRLQYATTRKSAISFNLFNDKKQTGILVDVEYIPGKKVSHFVIYNKAGRELDVEIEFLPEMFVKFTGRLDKVNGYKLITNYQVKWEGYNKMMKIVNNFVNKKKEITLSTSIGQKISFGVTLKRNNPKSIIFFADAFKYNGKIVGVLTKRNIQLRVVANRRMLVNLIADYNRATRQVSLSMENASRKKLFKVTGDYNKFTKQIKFAIQGLKSEWFQINGRFSKRDKMVMLNVFAMEKQLLKVVGSKARNSLTLNVMSMNKQLFKAVATKSKDEVSLNLSSEQIKRDITFRAGINRREMSAIVSAETAGNKVGITMRGDYKNYIIRFTGFVNKMESGWEMFMEKHAVVYKMIFTPTTSAQVVFEIQDDKIIKMTIQRTTGQNTINETAFQYTLSGEACKFMFKWNPQTIDNMIESLDKMIRPIVKKILTESSKFTTKAVTISRKFIDESSVNAKQAVLNFLERVDKSFDDIDFVGMKDKTGELTLNTLRKISQLVRKALIAAAKGVEAFKENIPMMIHKTKEMTIKAKEMAAKAKEMALKATEMMKDMQVDLEKNLNKINSIVMKVAMNLTESSKPVVNKAIELIKDFKFRGKPVKELVVLAQKLAQKYLDLTVEQGKILIADVKVKGTKLYNDVKVYVLKMKVPYRDETVEEVIEIVMKKATELKGKMSKVDIPKMIEEIRFKTLKYNIYGKPIEQHLVILKEQLKDLPETTRKAILELIRLTRVYSKEAQKMTKETYTKVAKVAKETYATVAKFSKPATDHAKFVAKTINKHFGPLGNKAVKQVTEQINAIELPKMTALKNARDTIIEQWRKIEQFFLPLFRPIPTLYNNLKEQIRQIQVMGFKVGPLVDMNMEILTKQATKLMKKGKLMVDGQIWLLNSYVDKYSKLTAEEIVNRAFDSSIEISKDAMVYLNKVYAERDANMKALVQQIKEVYTDMTALYNKMKSMPIEHRFEMFVHESSDSLMQYAEEVSGLLRQLAGLDISGPTWKAWTQADVQGHLARYGVNDKIMNAITAAKNVNLKRVVLHTIKTIRQFVANVYSEAFIKAVQTYGKMENVVDYIRSIPKKEYEQWVHELEDFYRKYERQVNKFMTKTYESTKTSSMKMYRQARSISEINYKSAVRAAKAYYEPAKDMYETIAEKSTLVYNEIRQPTIDVTNHYKNIASKFIEENYEIVYNRMLAEYTKARQIVEAKMSELQTRMEAEYEKFLNKYGDMTWEEIGENAYDFAEKKYLLAKAEAEQQYERMNKMALKLKRDAEKMYKEYYAKAMVEYAKYKKMAEDKYSELKPQAMEMYKKYNKMYNDYKLKAEESYKKGMANVNTIYTDMQNKAMTIYNQNKDKTLKKIYLEIKSYIVEQVTKQYKLAETVVNTKTTELKSIADKYYTKANVLMNTIILPELKKETISLINQSLRFSVIMANETVKAYYPHYILVKDTLFKAADVMKKETLVAYQKSKIIIQENTQKLIKLLNELLEKIQKHEMFNKGKTMVNDALNHKYVKRVTAQIKEMIKATQERIEKLQQHPQYITYKKEIEKRISLYRGQIEQYKEQLEQTYAKYSKHPKVLKAQKTLKQIQTSIMFTYNQLTKKVIPQFEMLAGMMTSNMNNIPIAFKKGFTYFRQEPENAFWDAINMAKTGSVEAYRIMKNTNLKQLEKQYSTYIVIAKELGEMILEECFDDWTKSTANTIVRDAKTNFRFAQRKLKQLPQKVQRMAMKEYNKQSGMLKRWVKQQYKYMTKQWNKCPCKAFFTNRLWKEIADEVMNHELVDASRTVAGMTQEKFIELKDMAIAEFQKQREIATLKFNELKDKATQKFYELKHQATHKYEELIEKLTSKYTEMIAKVENFIETTTIADIVAFTKKTYKQAVVKVEELRERLMAMKEKYIVEAKRLYAEYSAKAIEKYEELYAKAEALVMKYKNKAMPYYLKYKAQGEKIYNKYYPIVMSEYNKLQQKAMKFYKQAKYTLEEELEKFKVRYEVLKADAIKMFNDYKSKAITMAKKAKVDAINKWTNSELRAKLLALKKMSIRETIEALKKLPADTKKMVVDLYTTYSKLAMQKWDAEYKRFNEMRVKYTAQLKAKVDEIIRKLKPYTVPIVEAYKWTENEIKETALFIYKYHQLNERYQMARDYITSEYKRVSPMLKPTMEKYAQQTRDLAMKYADEYSVLAKDYAKNMISRAGYGTLRGIHSTLRYIDNIDVNAIKTNMNKRVEQYANFVKKYVSIDTNKGEFIISIPCTATPSFKHHITSVKGRVRRSVQTMRDQTQSLMKRVQSEYDASVKRLSELREMIADKVMENTIELRGDLQTSMKVNKKIAERLYTNAKVFAQKTYKKAMNMYKAYKPKAIRTYQKAKVMVKQYYKKFLQKSKAAYLKAGKMFWNMYKAGPTASYNMMRVNTLKYSKMMKQQAVAMYTKYQPIVKRKALKMMDNIKAKALQAKKEVEPYYRAVKTAVMKVKQGTPVKVAFQPIYREMVFASKHYQGLLNKKMTDMRKTACRSDAKLCKLVKDSMKIHGNMYTKYSTRALDMFATGKAHVQRMYRIMKWKINNKSFIMGEYLDVAMVFGDHFITFDNKMYDLPQNPGCEYLLAHDFVDDTFTIKKKNKAFIVETPEMQVTINADGTFKAKYGNQMTKSLPVESELNKCIRKEHIVTCYFKQQKLRVQVNLNKFMATISMSAWHFGKSQGLLGTNNRESFDDWKLPNGKITKDILQFINSYELSKTKKCQLTTVKKTKCPVVSTSKRCRELFVDITSPFAGHFRTVDPEVFFKTCEMESIDCKNKLPEELSHCGASAAYVSMVRARGNWISHLPECLAYKSHATTDKWTQRPSKKHVDVVLLMSLRQRNAGSKNTIAKVFSHLQRKFKATRYNTRYALIGFGGAGVHERSHIHPLGNDDVFGRMGELVKEIKQMPFNGKSASSNDGYHAILAASGLSFRPEAQRVFILVNSEPIKSFEHGPMYDETMYALTKEADATLYVFDKFSFKVSKAAGKPIGQSTSRMYTTKYMQGIADNNRDDYPLSEFSEMIEKTNGGWFLSNIRNPRSTSTSLFNAINQQQKKVGLLCKKCTVQTSWSDLSKALCVSDQDAKC